METWQLGALAGLALVDSTSFGTLLIPVWLMLAPRVRPAVVVLFLATVAVFYLAVGLLLVAGLDQVVPVVASWGELRALVVAQLVAGVALLAYSFRFPWGAAEPSPRARRWHARLSGERLTPRAAVVLALTAALLEVATMLPYLAAIGLLTTADLGAPALTALLAAYVVVMVLPALALLAVRMLAAGRLRPVLERVGDWLAARTGATLGWVFGVGGLLLASNAVGRL